MNKFNYDYDKHNIEVEEFLSNRAKGIDERVMMMIATNPRIILMDKDLNKDNISFKKYLSDPQTMLEVQCQLQEYCSDYIVFDKIMGFDNVKTMSAYADFQNLFEANYFGCDIMYHVGNEPGTKVCLNDNNKYDILQKKFDDPLMGIMGKLISYYEFFQKKVKEGYTYKGRPLSTVNISGLHTDGQFTNACCLRGATEICIDMYEDEKYFMELMEFLTIHTINRIKAGRKYFGLPEKTDSFSFADDSIALLHIDTYKEYILPFHKRLVSELSTGEKSNSIHLCGDATRFFPLLEKELNIKLFDTGFPVKHGELVRQLGNDVTVLGGVHIEILQCGTEELIKKETKRILYEVKPHTKNFIFREANNLTPSTPPENVKYMYEAVKKYGVYNR